MLCDYCLLCVSFFVCFNLFNDIKANKTFSNMETITCRDLSIALFSDFRGLAFVFLLGSSVTWLINF